jgi:hypothetical protein
MTAMQAKGMMGLLKIPPGAAGAVWARIETVEMNMKITMKVQGPHRDGGDKKWTGKLVATFVLSMVFTGPAARWK